MTAGRAVPDAIAGLHVLLDDDPRWPGDPVEQCGAALRAGVRCVQLRAKHATDGETLRFAAAIREATRETGALFVMNDRFDLALASEADGVHLGQEDMPPRRLPPDVRRRLLVGRSTHDESQAKAAREEDVDYVAYGPVFETATKETGYAARGLETLRRVVSIVAPLPVVAIGGIDRLHLPAVLEAGARGAAVISAVAGAADPEAAARDLLRVFEGARA